MANRRNPRIGALSALRCHQLVFGRFRSRAKLELEVKELLALAIGKNLSLPKWGSLSR